MDISNIHKPEDLEPLLDIIKKERPDVVPWALEKRGNAVVERSPIADILDGCLAGILYEGTDDTVCNIYESDAYTKRVELAKRWQEKGYLAKDVITNIESGQSQVIAGDAFAAEFGELGDVYGAQWRHWKKVQGGFIDQMADVIEQIKTHPDSRRLIVTAWNPEAVPTQALPPCHALFQFYVADGKISLQLYQRSADMFLGVPFNIASYSLLLHMVAAQTGYEAGEFVHTLGDAHIYNNHVDQVEEQLARPMADLPELWLNPDVKSIFDYTMDDIKIKNYHPSKSIKAPVAV